MSGDSLFLVTKGSLWAASDGGPSLKTNDVESIHHRWWQNFTAFLVTFNKPHRPTVDFTLRQGRCECACMAGGEGQYRSSAVGPASIPSVCSIIAVLGWKPGLSHGAGAGWRLTFTMTLCYVLTNNPRLASAPLHWGGFWEYHDSAPQRWVMLRNQGYCVFSPAAVRDGLGLKKWWDHYPKILKLSHCPAIGGHLNEFD